MTKHLDEPFEENRQEFWELELISYNPHTRFFERDEQGSIYGYFWDGDWMVAPAKYQDILAMQAITRAQRVIETSPRYPKYVNDPFYQKFNDPTRAYSNMNSMYVFYIQNPDRPRPSRCDLDHVLYAWDDAHGQLNI